MKLLVLLLKMLIFGFGLWIYLISLKAGSEMYLSVTYICVYVYILGQC